MSKKAAMEVCQNTYDEILMVRSLISLVRETCLNLELKSEYYENDKNYVLKLSEERNKYLNILSMAQDKLNNIEVLNIKLEDEIIN